MRRGLVQGCFKAVTSNPRIKLPKGVLHFAIRVNRCWSLVSNVD